MKGDVVVVPFPLSARSSSKSRPALVLAAWTIGGLDDYLLAMITSQPIADPHIVDLEAGDIVGGSLNSRSYVRPTYLFASDEGLITRRVGPCAPRSSGSRSFG
jgi:hypothetical protein